MDFRRQAELLRQVHALARIVELVLDIVERSTC